MTQTAKPIYLPDSCPICAEWRAKRQGRPRVCDECSESIPAYENMTDGYQAQSIDHNHMKMIGGMTGVMVVKKTLCLECYRKDFAAIYPNEELPV